MPIISKISVQKKDKERYNIFFSTGETDEYAFSVSEEVLIEHDLRKGKELSTEDIERILNRETIQKAYRLALQFLSYRMRSEKEVQTYLTERDFSEETVLEVLRRLRERKYVNDEEFTKAYINTQINTTDKGPKLIQNGLREKGISNHLIEEYMTLFVEEVQLEKAMKLCKKVAGKKKNVSTIQLRKDMQTVLMRKGYEQRTIQEAIAISMEEIDEAQNESAIIVQGEKALRKYRNEPIDKQKLKIKQYLYRKGFSLDTIDRFIEERIEE
ncbi:recombination regulator RecX [Pallidibacillus pasinlerensis]|uniref:Regulatory protein RecX n=1 Tax=Pallidibacillus pasinlerensis TaxID=2703818 RepID=A0ABX0A523_9BACI|nr:recombination regulator RecX [Pallidibacillus pasinlerensis]NCU17619.1 recombination regulator RecX [Pallidibacillus pasinlerensis]